MARQGVLRRSEDRIDLRTRPDIKRTLQRAAEATGSDLSKFVVSKAYEAAQKILAAKAELELSDRDRDIFLAALTGDDKPNEALRKASQQFKKFVK